MSNHLHACMRTYYMYAYLHKEPKFSTLVVAVVVAVVVVISVYCVPTNCVVLACNPCTSCIFVVVRRYEH